MFVIVPEPFSTDHKMVPFCTVAEKGIFSPPPSQNDVAEFILSICVLGIGELSVYPNLIDPIFETMNILTKFHRINGSLFVRIY